MTGEKSASARRRWFTGERYGGRAAVVGSVVAFGALFCFAGYTITDSTYLMSNGCVDHTGQILCPASGPHWARPLPGVAVLVGLLVGLAGVVTGRPFRTPALIAGVLLTAAALVASQLMAPK